MKTAPSAEIVPPPIRRICCGSMAPPRENFLWCRFERRLDWVPEARYSKPTRPSIWRRSKAILTHAGAITGGEAGLARLADDLPLLHGIAGVEPCPVCLSFILSATARSELRRGRRVRSPIQETVTRCS